MSSHRIDGESAQNNIEGTFTVSGPIVSTGTISSQNVNATNVYATNQSQAANFIGNQITPGGYTITFPAAAPATDQFLQANSSGQLAWVTLATGPSFTNKIISTSNNTTLTTRNDEVVEAFTQNTIFPAAGTANITMFLASANQFDITGYYPDRSPFQVDNTSTADTPTVVNSSHDGSVVLTNNTSINANNPTSLYNKSILSLTFVPDTSTTDIITISMTVMIGVSTHATYNKTFNSVVQTAGTPFTLYFDSPPYIPQGCTLLTININSNTGNTHLRTNSTFTDPVFSAFGDFGANFPQLTITTGTIKGITTVGGELKIYNESQLGGVILTADPVSNDVYSLKMPPTDGAAGQLLSTNGSGTLSWTTGLPSNASGYLKNNGTGTLSWAQVFPADAAGALVNDGSGGLSWSVINSAKILSPNTNTQLEAFNTNQIVAYTQNTAHPSSGSPTTNILKLTENQFQIPGHYPTVAPIATINNTTTLETITINANTYDSNVTIPTGAFSSGVIIEWAPGDMTLLNKQLSSITLESDNTNTDTIQTQISQIPPSGVDPATEGKYIIMVNNLNQTFLSTDFGANFNQIAFAITATECAISTNGQYIMLSDGTSNIYVSNNGGLNFTTVPINSGNIIRGIAMDYTGQYQLYMTNGEVSRSTNYGVSFTTVAPATGPSDVYYSQNGQYAVYFDNSGGGALYQSSDYGATWTANIYVTGGGSGIAAAISNDGQYITLVSQYNGVYVSNDGGNSVFAYKNFVTTDFGTYGVQIWMSATGQYQIISHQSPDITTNTLTYAHISNDYGVTWTPLDETSGTWSGTVALTSSGRYQYIIKNNILLVSSDYGNTFTQNNNLSQYTLSTYNRTLAVSSGFSTNVNPLSTVNQTFTNLSTVSGQKFTLNFYGNIPIGDLSNKYRLSIISSNGTKLIRTESGVTNPYNTYISSLGALNGYRPILLYTTGTVSSKLTDITSLELKNRLRGSTVELSNSPQSTTNYNLILPADAPTQDTILSATTGGQLSWAPWINKKITGTISAANVAAMYTTPLILVPAQGVGTLIVVDFLCLNFVYVSPAYTGGGNIVIRYGTTGSISALPNFINSSFITDINNGFATLFNGPIALNGSNSNYFNRPVVITNETGAFISGNSYLNYEVHYRVINNLL